MVGDAGAASGGDEEDPVEAPGHQEAERDQEQRKMAVLLLEEFGHSLFEAVHTTVQASDAVFSYKIYLIDMIFKKA